MVDFISVIKRAIDSLPENTPEMRLQIYDRARIAVSRQLAVMNPRPPQEIIDRQLSKLDNAILKVESKQHQIINIPDKKIVLDFSKRRINPSNCVLRISRLPVSSFSQNINSSNNRSNNQYAQKSRSLIHNFITKNLSDKIKNILSFSSYSYHVYNSKSVSINTDYRQDSLKTIGLEQFIPVNSYISVFMQKYLLSMKHGFLSFFPKLCDNNIIKYFVVSFIFLGVFIGISYSFSKSQGNTSIGASKSLDNNGKNQLYISSNTIPKITRRLLADGSEIDIGSSDTSAVSRSTVNNVFIHNSSVSDKNVKNSVVNISKYNKSEKIGGIEGESISFINKDYGNSVATNVAWSLQQGSQGLMIKGDISTIGDDLSASLIIKRNFDISLAATHLMEIAFSLGKENRRGDIADLRQISMRKTEKGPSVFFDSNIFMIAKNSYLISLKDSLNNAEILSEYRWIDIPITYSNGQRMVLTIDKYSAGGDVFKNAISNWGGNTKP